MGLITYNIFEGMMCMFLFNHHSLHRTRDDTVNRDTGRELSKYDALIIQDMTNNIDVLANKSHQDK